MEADFVPPSVTCSGATVNGTEFSTTHLGLPYYGFFVGLALIAVGIALLIAAQVVRVRSLYAASTQTESEAANEAPTKAESRIPGTSGNGA